MNLPNKITVARLILTVFIILLLCIPVSLFGFNYPKYDINGVVVQLLDLNRNPNKRLQLPRIFLDTFGGK